MIVAGSVEAAAALAGAAPPSTTASTTAVAHRHLCEESILLPSWSLLVGWLVAKK